MLYCTVQGSGEVCSQLQAGSLAPADLLSRHQVTLLHRTAAAALLQTVYVFVAKFIMLSVLQ